MFYMQVEGGSLFGKSKLSNHTAMEQALGPCRVFPYPLCGLVFVGIDSRSYLVITKTWSIFRSKGRASPISLSCFLN